jgi:pyridoxamine 5'-phosphate oxidase-like protein
MARWAAFAVEAPALAAFGEERLRAAPAYLATVRADGSPRVHPVTPIFGAGGLFLFMEPTSPKGRDLRERGSFAMHNGVPDMDGTGGEFWIAGHGDPVEDATVRAAVAEAAAYVPDDRYVLFELSVGEVRCNGYGDVALPPVTRWSDAARADAGRRATS